VTSSQSTGTDKRTINKPRREESGNLLAPADPVMVKAVELVRRLVEHNGGNWRISPEIKRLLRLADFAIREVGASYGCFWTPRR